MIIKRRKEQRQVAVKHAILSRNVRVNSTKEDNK